MTRRVDPLPWIGAAIVAGTALVALLAPVLAPYDPRAIAGPSLTAPSGAHPLGTNDAGQDILSQLVWGARSSTIVAGLGALLAVAVGVLVGVAVGSGLVRTCSGPALVVGTVATSAYAPYERSVRAVPDR